MSSSQKVFQRVEPFRGAELKEPDITHIRQLVALGKGWQGYCGDGDEAHKLIVINMDLGQRQTFSLHQRGRMGRIVSLSPDRFVVLNSDATLNFGFAQTLQLYSVDPDRVAHIKPVTFYSSASQDSWSSFHDPYLMRIKKFCSKNLTFEFLDCEKGKLREVSLDFPNQFDKFSWLTLHFESPFELMLLDRGIPKLRIRVEYESQGSELGFPKKLIPEQVIHTSGLKAVQTGLVSPSTQFFVSCGRDQFSQIMKMDFKQGTYTDCEGLSAETKERLDGSQFLGIIEGHQLVVSDRRPKWNTTRQKDKMMGMPCRLALFDLHTFLFSELHQTIHRNVLKLSLTPEDEIHEIETQDDRTVCVIFPFAREKCSTELFNALCAEQWLPFAYSGSLVQLVVGFVGPSYPSKAGLFTSQNQNNPAKQFSVGNQAKQKQFR